MANRDPSFAELAESARSLLAQIDDLVNMSVLSQTIQDFIELVEILESIAQSIVDREVRLLTDCIAHLSEFIEIRSNNGGATS